ncbi:hypothetical protein KB206_18320 [Microvirga sp. STS02]|uniref:hypothetical protein n=1 Tax=Hymenobacter negativus TaxID=2795026 RepID=UPI0018DE6A3A|nr:MULTISPECIES: hypothetical protein [Bacteria]MBH8570856.1 hypothetical protein [Hymenobacter negativus]MBR7210593.1 hypothetical protein [Microvirga sp. STS02]
MNFLPKTLCVALLSLFALAMAPAAKAQVNVNVNVGQPAWGPPVPQGTQFYYIPEIDGYYDLYAQQYIVFRNGQWVPVAVMDGYDPYQFHPVVLDYRGREPWVYVGAHRDRYPRRVVVVQPRPVIVRQRGLPPGQAKKLYREGYREGYRRGDDNDQGHGNGRGHGRGHGRD